MINEERFTNLFTQLKSAVPEERYDAMCQLARDEWPVENSSPLFFELYHEVWALTEDTDAFIRSQSGIAASMITARHPPDEHGMFFGIPIPDFLPEYNGSIAINMPRRPGVNTILKFFKDKGDL